jgi:hypothetical protein
MRESDNTVRVVLSVGTIRADLADEYIAAVKAIHTCDIWYEPRSDGSVQLKANVPQCERNLQSLFYNGLLRMFRHLRT